MVDEFRVHNENLERETGFEPATSTLARSHSTTELLPLVASFYCTCAFRDNSLRLPRRRIPRLAFKRALLALASLQATSSNHPQDEGVRDRSQYERAWRQSTPRPPR